MDNLRALVAHHINKTAPPVASCPVIARWLSVRRLVLGEVRSWEVMNIDRGRGDGDNDGGMTAEIVEKTEGKKPKQE
ncbi:hypothetical protein PPTG_24276 [Phytophthora nicotianae INRA-310]|uniref:Uncharacterized protein n=1 Tax=Phytophthora nicotianae (strain INRA-310) TaxID=761204 RepID=W2PI54_PHYN3|nr:hypothetical protein PPTG_24276 [Phytophthora nicotianae INRA-310]ETN00301.1 hypothetical protein PPTG_24276 [Phytophthora nicotianae INRA-310]